MGDADLVIHNAKVYTVDERLPWAEAVAIRDGRITWVGKRSGIKEHLSSRTEVLDAGGRLVLPGFVDSHNHIAFGSDPDVVDLGGARTLEDLLETIEQFASSRPDLEWIEGQGWNYSVFPDGRMPTAVDLEGLTGGRPAFLVSYDGHTAWLNRIAIAQLGIDDDVQRLPFGEVVRDPDGGGPTGLLESFATLGLSKEGEEALGAILPSSSPERKYRSLTKNLRDAVSYGITTVVEPQSFLKDLPLYRQARKEGALLPRLQVALFHARGTSEALLTEFDAARWQHDDDQLRIAAVKIYIDDVIEPHTAAMLEPYSDAPGERGDTLYPPEEFDAAIARIDRMGFQVFIHAIGDRGIRVALDALQRARERNGPRDSRHQLVHVECPSPEDIPRFRELGVVACMQPRHCAPDITGKWAASVGPKRSRYAWPFRSLAAAGAVVAFSSDWNVAEMDPLVGIYSALTRRSLDGEPAGGWIPEETIDLDSAIRAYTIQGAYANFLDGNRGSISPGKYADLIVLSDNLFEMDPEKIPQARVELTLVGGKEVYRSDRFAGGS
jgi:predicted amidohydrolase YtcJ